MATRVEVNFEITGRTGILRSGANQVKMAIG